MAKGLTGGAKHGGAKKRGKSPAAGKKSRTASKGRKSASKGRKSASKRK
jgi:hypothetical protein